MVTIQRLNGGTGALVNEMALEEETRAGGSGCDGPGDALPHGRLRQRTRRRSARRAWRTVRGLQPTWMRWSAASPSATSGEYGLMTIFGEETAGTPPLPGMRAGEAVHFKVNGIPAVAAPDAVYGRNAHPADRSGGQCRTAISLSR